MLEAQVAALQDLTAEFMGLGLAEGSTTITVLSFNSRALPTAPIEGQTYPRVIFGDDEVLSGQDVDASLAALQAGGETNYVAAVFAATGTIQTLEQQRGDAVNLVYFISDGNPFPANSQPASLIRVENVAGLDFLAGQSNTAVLVIDFDQNGDLVADSSVSMDVEIEGVLPESFDL